MANYEILKITHQGKSFIVGAVQDGDDRTWKTWSSEEELANAIAAAGPEAEAKLDGYLALSFSSKKLDANIKALGFREIPALKKQAVGFIESDLQKETQKQETNLADLTWDFDADDFEPSNMQLYPVEDDDTLGEEELLGTSPTSASSGTDAEKRSRHEGLIDLLVAQDEARRKARQEDKSQKPASIMQDLSDSLRKIVSRKPADPEINDFEALIHGVGDDDIIDDDVFSDFLPETEEKPVDATSLGAISRKEVPPPGPREERNFIAGGYQGQVSLKWQPAPGSGFRHGRRSEMVWASENIRPEDVLSLVPVFYRGTAPSIEIRPRYFKVSDDQKETILRLLAQVLNPQFAERPAIILRERRDEFVISIQARPEEFCLISKENAELLLQVTRAAVRAASLTPKP